jgi:hypothetical protein
MEPTLSRDAYIQAMRRRVEEMLGKIADAVNEAAPGRIIAGSEEKVRDLFADLRRQAFEQAVQMRVDAAEAAFPLRRIRRRKRANAIRDVRITRC